MSEQERIGVEEYLVEEYLEEEHLVGIISRGRISYGIIVEESLDEEYLENIFVRGSDHPVCYINRLPQQQSQYRYRFATSQYPISNNSYNLHNTILMHKMED